LWGFRYKLTLYAPARLIQDIEEEFRLGSRCFSAENIVVVPRLVEEEVRAAVAELAQQGFDTLRQAG